jgi:dihydrodipicolinate synthase/N-acetylneuraminate lyase
MVTAADLHGIMAMMPAFTTDDGDDVHATDTVDVARLHDGVDRIITDGANAIATTGSFGEFSNLLPAEFETLVRSTVEAVDKRVPTIIGCTSLHTREAMQRMEFIRDAGADAVIVGVPYYFPSTVANAVRFYRDVAEMFPTLGVLIYHNPTLHHVTLPVDAFTEITKSPNVIGMKDSHRSPAAFMELMKIVRGKISVFVHQAQYYPYAELGASGFWSIDAWMGLEPLVFLRDAVDGGDIEAAKECISDTQFKRGDSTALQWREPGHKIAVRFAGYCDPGPLRPPFLEIPQDVLDRQKARAEHWRSICEKYRDAGKTAAAE